jgi:hypothetical protein
MAIDLHAYACVCVCVCVERNSSWYVTLSFWFDKNESMVDGRIAFTPKKGDGSWDRGKKRWRGMRQRRKRSGSLPEFYFLPPFPL